MFTSNNQFVIIASLTNQQEENKVTTMLTYKGKSKCSFNCTKRAKFKALRSGMHDMAYACHEHSVKIAHLDNPEQESDNYSEADYQTWLRL